MKLVKMLKTISVHTLTIISLVALLGCDGFREALRVQNEFFSDFNNGDSSILEVEQDYSPTIKRGVNVSIFAATLPRGSYVCIAISSGRCFYQAPSGFSYRINSEVQTKVGGIVEAKKGSGIYYVWYFNNLMQYVEIDPSGEWINDVKPGILNVQSRPWVEQDLSIKLFRGKDTPATRSI